MVAVKGTSGFDEKYGSMEVFKIEVIKRYSQSTSETTISAFSVPPVGHAL